MNVYVVTGLLIVAIGSGVAIYGQYLKSKTDNATTAVENDKKLQQIMSDIQSIKNSNPPPEVAAKIEKVEDEFRSWASEFGKKKAERRVDFEKAKLDQAALELKMSRRYRPFLEFARDTLEKAVVAYNAESQENVRCELRRVPDNIYDLSDARQGDEVGNIVFGPTVAWVVFMRATLPAREDNRPTMTISFVKDPKEGWGTNRFSIYPDLIDGVYRISFSGERVPSFVGINSQYPMEGYEKTLRDVLLKVFEAQVLALPEVPSSKNDSKNSSR